MFEKFRGDIIIIVVCIERKFDLDRSSAPLVNGVGVKYIPNADEIPYLNGGLFQQEKIDEVESVFPAGMFQSLFDFFDSYNFTIDENDPNDAEVGVDPEMLGKIFENLLEDNKDKGAFYTPKEIVRYMCQESLTAATPMMMPSMLRKDRNLLLSMAVMATFNRFFMLISSLCLYGVVFSRPQV